MTLEREKHTFLARLCEQAQRYDDMVTHVNEVAMAGDELSFEEQNLLSTAYRNAVGPRRTTLRIISLIEALESTSETHATAIREFHHEILKELRKFCEDVLKVLDERLIPNATLGMSKVFFYKMKGDYNRYLAEFELGEKRKTAITSAREAYNVELVVTHPLRLGVALNLSIFYYEIQNSPDQARNLAQQAIDDATAELGSLSEESFRDCTLVIQLLRDSLTIWTSSDMDEAETPPTVLEMVKEA